MRGVSGGGGTVVILDTSLESLNLTTSPLHLLSIFPTHTHHTYSVLGNVAGIIDIHTGRMYFSFLC